MNESFLYNIDHSTNVVHLIEKVFFIFSWKKVTFWKKNGLEFSIQQGRSS